MTTIARRVVLLAAGAAPYTAAAHPGVQCLVSIYMPPSGAPQVNTPFATANPTYYDVLDNGTTDDTGYTLMYIALLDNRTGIRVLLDNFTPTPGSFPHNFFGWPIPSYPYP